MRARNKLYLMVVVLLCVPLAYFVIDRTYFEIVSVETTGIVESIAGRDDRCGKRRRRYSCTKFTATLRYEVQQSSYLIDVSAGTARGHGQSISKSDYYVGQSESIAYDPSRPTHAYRNKLWDIWGAPLLTFILQVCAYLGSLKDRREER